MIEWVSLVIDRLSLVDAYSFLVIGWPSLVIDRPSLAIECAFRRGCVSLPRGWVALRRD